MKEMIFYTDGACSDNPGPGGYAFVLEEANMETNTKTYKAFYNFDSSTTNNRMEMLALIGALEYCLQNEIISEIIPILIYSDSKYVIDGVTQWVQNWKKNNWLTANKKDVKNKDLWVHLDDLMTRVKPKLEWVKGHSNNVGNNIADQIAVCAIKDHAEKCKCKMLASEMHKWHY